MASAFVEPVDAVMASEATAPCVNWLRALQEVGHEQVAFAIVLGAAVGAVTQAFNCVSGRALKA